MPHTIKTLLQALSKSLDKPFVDDSRIDFTTSETKFPRIGSQSRVSDETSWSWQGVTRIGQKPCVVPLKLRKSQIQVAFGTIKWQDHVSQKANRRHFSLDRQSPLFLADAKLTTIDDPDHPDFGKTIISLIEPPAVNHSLLEWLNSYGIKAEINPDAPILQSFRTTDQSLCPIISDDLHIGIFLSARAHLAHSVDPDRKPDILSSPMIRLLAGEPVEPFPLRRFKGAILPGISLDVQQHEAVTAALSGETFVLIGPPGCGKTQASAAMITNLKHQFPELTIGFASPVDAALDALRRLINDFKVEYEEIRIGKNQTAVHVDVLIVDESSRTTTAEIIPFATKSSQIIIIGDPDQTPPSPVAPRLDETDTSLIDKALKNPGFKKYELRNHYRSLHPDLLEFSNDFIYNSRLRVVPSPEKPVTDGLCINYIPQAAAYSCHHEIKNIHEIKIMAIELIKAALLAKSRGISRSRMAVGWTHPHARLLEKTIRDELKKQNLSEDILSPVANEPFIVYAGPDVHGQERDETWISFGHGFDPNKSKFAKADQMHVNMSSGVLQKMNVLLTRSRIATHLYHSLSPTDISTAKPSPENIALLALIHSELTNVHARYQLEPDRRANALAIHHSRNDPTLPHPEAYNLACVYGVRDAKSPPNSWRYGLFRDRREWSSEEAQTARKLLLAKGWKLIPF